MKTVDEEILRKMFLERETITDIAESLGVCVLTASRKIKKLGLTRAKISNVDDITDQKFGLLVPKRFSHFDKFGKAIWWARCECGREKTINSSAMKAGLTKSCGCLKSRLNRKGVGNLSGAYWHKVKAAANQRNIEMSVTIHEAYEIFERQLGKCALSGVDIVMFQNNYKYKLQTASLDRIDSSVGYVKGNIQWVHKRVNFLKRNYTEQELVFWCQKIATLNSHRFSEMDPEKLIERRGTNESFKYFEAT